MSTPLSSLSKRSQRLLVCGQILPWLAFTIVALDWLPASWQFEHWPIILRAISLTAFALFFIAEVIFAVWYLGNMNKEATDD